MFGRRKNTPSVTISTLVGRGTRISGDLHFEGGCHVDGEVRGNLKACGDGPSLLTLSEHGRVEGNVVAPHVLLHGCVTGDVYATERVELGPTARVNGNVHYRLIQMAAGAEINGKLIRDDQDTPLLEHDGAATNAAAATDAAVGTRDEAPADYGPAGVTSLRVGRD